MKLIISLTIFALVASSFAAEQLNSYVYGSQAIAKAEQAGKVTNKARAQFQPGQKQTSVEWAKAFPGIDYDIYTAPGVTGVKLLSKTTTNCVIALTQPATNAMSFRLAAIQK